MQIKTITTVTGVNEIDFGNDDSQATAHFYWFKNLSDSTLYVSAMSNPVAGEDNVAELSAKGAASVETDEGKVYVLGAGKVEIHRTNSKFCPFELPSTGSGGGGGGGSITVDSELSETSENPLQNKATTVAINEVKSELDTKSDVNHIHDITASGNPVTLTNLQGGVPFSEMVVSGKNLLKYPYADTTKTVNGITFTDNGDGTITANGTATANATFLLARNFGFEKEGNYFLSGCPSGGGLNLFYINWYQNHTGVTIKNYNDYGSGVKIPYQHIFSENNSLAISIIAGATVENIVFRPQIELGSTATAYEPPITGRELQVDVSGKNLMKYPYSSENLTVNNVVFTVNSDGTIHIKSDGAVTARSVFWLENILSAFVPPRNTPIYISASDNAISNIHIGYGLINGNTWVSSNGMLLTGCNMTFDYVGYDRVVVNITVDAGDPVDVTLYPQLEIGDTATPYEPYSGSVTTIMPTSNPYTIPNDIRQVDGLNNISVSAGELSVVGVQKNAAIKKIWNEIGDIKTILATVTGGIE